MSRDAGKTRTGKKQLPKSRPGRRTLAEETQEFLTLTDKADALALSKETHSHHLLDNESNETQAQVEQMSLDAQKLREIQEEHKFKPKIRSHQIQELNSITEDEPGEDNSSSEQEQEEIEDTHSKLSSHDTQPYSEQSKLSPTLSYRFGKSPNTLDTHAPPFVFNSQPQATANVPVSWPKPMLPRLQWTQWL